MATYRKIQAPVVPALISKDFPEYAGALAYSRNIGAHRPIRMLTSTGIVWRVVKADTHALKQKPTYEKLPHWTRPAWWNWSEGFKVLEDENSEHNDWAYRLVNS